MKSILHIIFFLSFISGSAQVDCGRDSIKYINALNYVINDAANDDKTIEVSDSIIDLDRFWFSEFLIDYPIEKAMVDQYRSRKSFVWFNPFYSPCIASLFSRMNCANNVLFFSNIEDNILRADLLPIKNRRDKYHYDKIASFVTGTAYLFVFDDINNIKIIFCKNITYD